MRHHATSCDINQLSYLVHEPENVSLRPEASLSAKRGCHTHTSLKRAGALARRRRQDTYYGRFEGRPQCDSIRIIYSDIVEQTSMTDIEIPADVFLAHGLRITRYEGGSKKRSRDLFVNFFGCSPEVAAEIWELLLLHTNSITPKSCPFYFLCGLYLLKVYDIEAVLAGTARCHPDTFRKHAWYYVYAISDLEAELVRTCTLFRFCPFVITCIQSAELLQHIPLLTSSITFLIIFHLQVDMDNRFIGKLPNQHIFLSVDGVDFKVWEPESDWAFKPAYCSHKHKSAAYRYEIALCIATGDCVWINGPERGGETDAVIFKEDLASHLQPGEQCEGDGHYQMMVPQIFPRRVNRDETDMANAIRARHETFNGKLKNFASMNNTFRHGLEKHAAAFRACTAITQLRIDRGEIELFYISKDLIERAIKK